MIYIQQAASFLIGFFAYHAVIDNQPNKLLRLLFPKYYAMQQEIEDIIQKNSSFKIEKIKELRKHHEECIKGVLRALGFYHPYEQEKTLKTLTRLKKNYDTYRIDQKTVTHDFGALSEDLIEYCKQQLLAQGLDINNITITSKDDRDFQYRITSKIYFLFGVPFIKQMKQKLNFNPNRTTFLSKEAMGGIINHEITHIKEYHVIESIFFDHLYKEWKVTHPQESTIYIDQALQQHSYSCEYMADQSLSLENYTNARAMRAVFERSDPTKAGFFCFAATVASAIATCKVSMNEYASEEQKFLSAWCLSLSTNVLLLSMFGYYLYTKDQISHPSPKKRNDALKQIMLAHTMEEQLRKDRCVTA